MDQYFDLWQQAQQRIEKIAGNPVHLEVEPGRYLVAECGYLVTKIRSTKTQGTPGSNPQNADAPVKYLLIDAGFNDLVRPAMYGAYHHISVVAGDGRTIKNQDDFVVGGPLCESCDVFTQEDGGFVTARRLSAGEAGDLVILHDAGAYGMAMSSNYNSRRLAAEVLLHDGKVHVVRERQPFEQLTANERVPAGL